MKNGDQVALLFCAELGKISTEERGCVLTFIISRRAFMANRQLNQDFTLRFDRRNKLLQFGFQFRIRKSHRPFIIVVSCK